MKRAVALMMTFLMLFGLFACDSSDGDTSEQTTGAGVGTMAEDLGIGNEKGFIVKDGIAQCTIVYERHPSSSLEKAIKSFITQIKNQTGVELESVEDDKSVTEGRKILIGDTSYTESQTVKATLKSKEWAIVEEGEHMVFVGYDEDLLIKALSYYTKNLLEDNVTVEDGKRTLAFKGYEERKEEAVMLINGVDIKNFKIVYASEPEGLSDAADLLKTALKEKYDVDLVKGKDSDVSEGEYEILIGNTNRLESKKYYTNNTVKLMSYKMHVEGKKVIFACGGAYSAGELGTMFKANYIKNGKTEINDGDYLEKNLLTLEDQPKTDGSDIRVMTSNILAYRWEGNLKNLPTMTKRAEIYAATLAVYKPDLVGVQESDAPWASLLTYYLKQLNSVYGLDYEWILGTEGSTPNLTSIIYRKDKFRVVETDVQHFSYKNPAPSYLIRVVAWAVFEEISGGTKYALFNTHFATDKTNGDLEPREEAAIINTVKSKYPGVNVFCTGDFNFHMNNLSESFKEHTGLKDSRETADSLGCLVNRIPGISEGIYIDRIFFDTNQATVMRHETVNKNLTGQMSDHLPQYGDFKVKK